MNKEIKNTKVEIVRTKNIPRRDNDHVLFNFRKFHNNNIIQRIVLVGPVVNYECGSFAVDPCFTTRKRNNVEYKEKLRRNDSFRMVSL